MWSLYNQLNDRTFVVSSHLVTTIMFVVTIYQPQAMWLLTSDHIIDAILSQILASIVGANFFDHSTMVTMLSPSGCYLNNLMFGLLWLHSSHNVVTKFRPLFMVTICGYYLTVFFLVIL